jgi:alkylation response protein AidB-like acyl-CoA dehydrogenase
MTVEVDSTLELIADVAAEFATLDADRVRALRDAGAGVERGKWSELAELGWIGITVPEAKGGAGLGVDAVAIIARSLGRAASPEPYVAAGVLAPAVLAASDRAAESGLLESVIAGEQVVALAWQGPRGGLGLDAVAVESDGARLDGDSRFTAVGGVDKYLVAAREGDGTAVYAVPAGTERLEERTEARADGSLSTSLALDSVAVSAEARLLGPNEGEAAVAAALETARVVAAAELVGLGEQMIALTLEFMRDRKQFGRPIGGMQALQHRIVDAWIQSQLSGAALDAALRVHADPDASAVDRAAAASSVQARASAATARIAREALQLHGAIGFTDELDLGLYINRALAVAPWLGTATEHRRRFAELTPIGSEG